MSVDTLDWYLTDQHPEWYSVDTQSVLDQQSVDGRQVSTDSSIEDNLDDSWLIVDWEIDGVSMGCQPRCWWSINRVSTAGWLTVSINTLDALSTHDLISLIEMTILLALWYYSPEKENNLLDSQYPVLSLKIRKQQLHVAAFTSYIVYKYIYSILIWITI